MTIRLVLAWLHLVALAIGVGGVWSRARALRDRLRDPEDPRAIRRALVGDAWRAIILALILAPLSVGAQARTVSVPPGAGLLDLVHRWSQASPIGDLRALSLAEGDVEVRAWSGFGLDGGTNAVRLRRVAGEWQAWELRRVECSIAAPRIPGATLSAAERARWQVEARTRCGEPLSVTPSAWIISDDTLTIIPLDVPSATIDSSWTRAARIGLRTLPTRPAGERTVLDGITHVIEVREGGAYRASEITFVGEATTDAARRVQAIVAALRTFRVNAPPVGTTP